VLEQLHCLNMTILVSAFMIDGMEIRTASIMHRLSALIPAYPEIQREVHEELHGVVGHDRLPTK
jgi:hypothetical protein